MGQRATLADSGSNGHNGGRFEYDGGDEVHLDAYDEDPVMYRRGQRVTETGGGGGCDAWDVLPDGPGGRRVQILLVHGEQSEQVRGQVGNPMGSYNVFANDGSGEGDAAMRRVFRLEATSGPNARDGSIVEAFFLGEPQWESLLRQLQARLAGVAIPPPVLAPVHDPTQLIVDHMTSSGGRFVKILQESDGDDVIYDTWLGTVGDPKAAIWSSFGGKIRSPATGKPAGV